MNKDSHSAVLKESPLKGQGGISWMLISLALSVGLTILFYITIKIFWGGTYVETVFCDRGIIPYMTTLLSWLAVTQLLAILFKLNKEKNDLIVLSGILRNLGEIDISNLSTVRKELTEKLQISQRQGLVAGRVNRVINRLENEGSASDVAALLSEQAEIDRAVYNNNYALVRFAIWLIPVLGFIGTVLGISVAIASFPELFESAADDLGDQLGPVTASLGVAFETTLLALIKVAIVMFVMFPIQKRGTDLLNRFDEFCLDTLLGSVKGAGIPEKEELPAPFRDFARILCSHVETMERKFESAVNNIIEKLVEQERKRWENFTDVFRDLCVKHHETVASTMENALSSINEQMTSLRHFASELANQDVERREAFTNTFQEICTRQREAVASSLENTLSGFKEEMAGLQQFFSTSEQFMTIQQTLNANLEALTGSQEMVKTLEALKDSNKNLEPVLRELAKRRNMQVRIVEEKEEA